MNILPENIPASELYPLGLRALYRSRGCRLYKAADFEPYDLYRENRSIMPEGGVLTFSDGGGRLMALKPDVTISIVKDTKPGDGARKLFYSEHVFRRRRGSEGFAEIEQLGLEYIGAGPGPEQAEVVELALLSLAAAGREYSLSLSHMGYVEALLDDLPQREGVAGALRRKSLAGMEGFIAGAAPVVQRALRSLIDLPPESGEALELLKGLSPNRAALAAALELEELFGILGGRGLADCVRLDFSVLGDFAYYNGLIFQGYVRGVPRAVLSGGRYDRMMRLFGKPQDALGFAIYLNELESVFPAEEGPC